LQRFVQWITALDTPVKQNKQSATLILKHDKNDERSGKKGNMLIVFMKSVFLQNRSESCSSRQDKRNRDSLGQRWARKVPAGNKMWPISIGNQCGTEKVIGESDSESHAFSDPHARMWVRICLRKSSSQRVDAMEKKVA
jgi:hypothetical protein